MNERKTIYCRNEEVWSRVVQCAEEGGISISQILLSPFLKSGTISVGLGQINRIEGKLDELLRTALGRKIKGAVAEIEKPVKIRSSSESERLVKSGGLVEKPIEDVEKSGIDDNKLQEAQSRLLKIRKDKGITSLTGHSGPLPKVGKKGK